MDPTAELSYLQLLLPLIGVVSVIVVGVVLLHQHFRKSLYKQQLAREELKNKHQQELLRNAIQVQEEERKRISQDLHDELGAALSISRMHLLRLEKLGQSDQNKAVEELPKVREYVESALASTRRISHELMPAQLQMLGLAKALEGVAHWAGSASELEPSVEVNGNLNELPWDTTLGLYRIYTELINNTLKHAEASTANLKIDAEFQSLSFQYWDNGKGLPVSARNVGMGLKGMEGRVSALNGELKVGNNDAGGFFANIKLPIQ
jgi:signal transduction histidine kinase